MRLDPKFKDYQAKHKWEDDNVGKSIENLNKRKFVLGSLGLESVKNDELSYDDINKALEKLDKREDINTQAYSDAGVS